MTQKFEAFVGLCVVIVAMAFLFILTQVNASSFTSDTYPIRASFNNISGISVGSDVKMSGVKIGTVQAANLNPQDFRAEVTLSIYQDIKLPVDSTIKIASDGLLGGASVNIEAGFEDAIIKSNGQFSNVQGSVNLIDLISKVIFSAGGK